MHNETFKFSINCKAYCRMLWTKYRLLGVQAEYYYFKQNCKIKHIYPLFSFSKSKSLWKALTAGRRLAISKDLDGLTEWWMADVIIVTDTAAQSLQNSIFKWICVPIIFHIEAFSCYIVTNPSLPRSDLVSTKPRASVRKCYCSGS